MALPEKRQAEILRLVRADGSASVSQLARTLKASFSTIRRDLDKLTEMGYIARSHGGAVIDPLQRTTFEAPSALVSKTATAEKAAIGRMAAEFASPGQCILFDSGSTVAEAAHALIARDIPITAVTNDLRIASIFSQADHVTLVVLGGTRRFSQFTLLGEPATSFLSTLHVDLAFIGIHSFFEGKLTETSIDVANIKRQILKSARQSILLADSSKNQHHAFKEVADLSEFDAMITDEGLPSHTLELLRRFKVDIRLAPLTTE